ncbi:MAG: ABC transporter ATP-binding protein [Chloroflexi bacterium]|nr:ABC transporter ATP-binding protein [Chloroflexota bacterium]MBL7061160.1 ABC transporter ATP-binding protein [Dehalococcoidia bacterium]
MLKVRDIDVFHETFQALWNVSLDVRKGEMLALIGANTSGKSTLLDTISGLLHPTKGSIEFEGKDITKLDPYQIVELGITQVPEGRGIFPEMTALDNLVIGSYSRQARAKREQNLKKVYEHFPILEGRKKQTAKTLSGGEQQMLSIGRGLMADPKLMLLDEMSLGLAPIIVNELFKALREIRETGITILFVEQNVRRSIQEADRAYILENGRVTLSGTSAELCEEEQVKKAYFGITTAEICEEK